MQDTTDTKNASQQLFDVLRASGIEVPDEYRNSIERHISKIVDYRPVVGVFGKTGAGKSSLCNALFGQDICAVSNIEACTRELKEVALGIGNKGITLLDVPGVGESSERDKEYAVLYQSLMPKLDLVLWVLKGDDRAYTSDESFFKAIVKPYIEAGIPFFFVINQVDKIEPFREWDVEAHQPGPRQAQAIEQKRHAVAGYFSSPLDRVRAVSAEEQYGLIDLVDAIVHALPSEKRIAVLREVRKEHRSEKTVDSVSESTLDNVIDFIVDALKIIPPSMKSSAKKVLKAGASKVANWFKKLF